MDDKHSPLPCNDFRYSVLEMPMTKDHKGPASEDETHYIIWQVIDLVSFLHVYESVNKSDVEYIAACLNLQERFEPLVLGALSKAQEV